MSDLDRASSPAHYETEEAHNPGLNRNLNPQQFYHGTSGAHSFEPGDILTPEGARNSHVYYTSSPETARHYAGWGGDLDDPQPGHVYQVQPETGTGRKLGRHGTDPWSGLLGNGEAYRTKGRLRVLGEVDMDLSRPSPAALIERERSMP